MKLQEIPPGYISQKDIQAAQRYYRTGRNVIVHTYKAQGVESMGHTGEAHRGKNYRCGNEKDIDSEVGPVEQNSPAKELENFLNFIDQCVQEYKAAYENVNEEDRRLQDLVHAMEFAVDKSERNRVATKFQRSRKYRRQNKDIVKRNERIVKFFEEQKNRDTLNRMRQLLGQQRKEEEYLDGERVYKPRVGKG